MPQKLHSAGFLDRLAALTGSIDAGCLVGTLPPGLGNVFVNPMTAQDDLIVGGVAGVPGKLAVGTAGQYLSVSGGHVAWVTPSDIDYTDPLTTKGDLVARSTVTTRIGVGSDGQVLIADSTQTVGIKWGAPAPAYPLLAPDGSGLAPSYSFASETNSGPYRAASQDVRMAINGVDIMRWQGGGLGTEMDTNGSIQYLTMALFDGGSGGVGNLIRGRRAQGTLASPSATAVGTNMLIVAGYGWDGSSWNAATEIDSTVDGTVAANSIPGRISLGVTPIGGTSGPVEAMRIVNSGQVLLGRTGDAANAPIAKAHVVSSTSPQFVIQQTDANKNGGVRMLFMNGAASGNYNGFLTWNDQIANAFVFNVSSAVDGTTIGGTPPPMVIKFNGNIGINVSSPQFALDLKGLIRTVPVTGASLKVGGSMFDHFVDAGNGADTTEDTLYTDTLVANVFTNNGDKVWAVYAGTLANNADTKRIRVYIGGTLIYDSGTLSVTAAGDFDLDVLLIRDGTTTLRARVKALYEAASVPDDVAVTKVTGLTLTGALVLKVTGTASAANANDIAAILGTVSLMPAA